MTSPPMPDQTRTAGVAEGRLLRVVGVWALAAAIVNVTIGGGIFRLPAGLYHDLGASSPVAYLVCAVLMALIVSCFAEAGSRVPLTGGLYAYIEVAFGPFVGFIAGFLLWAGMTAAVSAVSAFLGDAIGALCLTLGPSLPRAVVIASVLGLLGAMNVFGVGNAARFNTLMTVAKLAPLVVVILVGLPFLRVDRVAIQAPRLAPLARGSVFLIFAFLGVESALVPSGEVRDPESTVPRAIAIALGVVVVVYVFVQLVAQSAVGAALGDSKTPVADAAGVLLGPTGRTLILVGTAISMFGYVSGMTLAVPRILYAFGRDGFAFRWLAGVHPRYRTPVMAIVTQTIINIGLALTGTFERLALAANGSVLLVYAVCALAVLRLRQQNVRTARSPFVAPLGGAVPILAFIAIVWLLWSLTRTEWLALIVVGCVAVAIFLATRSRRIVQTEP
jgi:APA family basic amino acid/polyamine antiporter